MAQNTNLFAVKTVMEAVLPGGSAIVLALKKPERPSMALVASVTVLPSTTTWVDA